MDNINIITEAWNVHLSSQIYVLDAIPAEALTAIGIIKGRTAGEIFAHIHNIRLTWLEVSGPHLMEGILKVGKEDVGNHELLKAALETSGKAVAAMLTASEQAVGKVKGFKRGVAVFFGYLVAHESYHMGEIGIVLNQAGHKLDQEVGYGMWEWGKL